MKAREVARLLANDSAECRNCHEVNAMDMDQQSRMAKTKDTSIRRHADCQELSDEQLKVIIAELMPQ